MTRIKICGLRTLADINSVNRYQPDYAGVILSAGYRRSIPKAQACRMKAALDPSIRMTGVFVNEEMDSVISFVQEGVIDVIQLHGQESNEQIDELRSRVSGIPVWKAFRVAGPEDVISAQESHADLILLDSGTGTGKTFDWPLLSLAKRPYILAGGLNPDNIGAAVASIHPYGVDTSTGVETDGVKDAAKIRTFIEIVRKDS